MDQWEGILIFEDLKMNAMVQYQWPSSCAGMEGRNETGPRCGGWGHVAVKMTVVKKQAR